MRRASSHHEDWWTAQDEAYWQALLEQGEVALDTVPPADPQHLFDGLGIVAEPEPTAAEASRVDTPAAGEVDRWQLAQIARDRGELFQLPAVAANRGGLLVEWNGLQGFVPASHLREVPRWPGGKERIAELSRRIGDTLVVRLIEVDPAQDQLVFSERAAGAEAQRPVLVLAELQPGQVRRGTVTNLTSFGAFVELGGVEGLIHVSEMSWERVRHPGDLLHPGQEVEVFLLGVNPEEGRIALSLKRLHPNPWAQVETRYQVGQLVEGTVTSVVSFGAFVRVEDGLEGLIHLSELAEGSFLHPKNVLREGDIVRVRVLNIDAANRRLGLSLRQGQESGAQQAIPGYR